ncbi:MAG: hypothetical protein NTW82_09270 [Bacteroidia bacterium]|nr:hypothetical protein [Bacteroidia bacterium]
MNKKKFLLLFTGLLFTLVLSAQYTDFDLSKYKLPDIRLNRLDATFDFNNDVNRYVDQELWDTTESKFNDLAGSLNLNYHFYRNTEKYQGKLDVGTYLHPTIYKYDIDNNKTENKYMDGGFVISSTNRFYNQRMFFVEVDPGFSFSSTKYYELHENSNTTETDSREADTRLSAPVSVGYGRIEPVEDLRLALYILEELQKAGRIKAVPPEDVIIDMAREISKIRKKRFFDTRLRKIEELHVIDSFLVTKNIVSSNDITCFAVLNDQWDYASGPAREAGFAVNAGIGNDILLNRYSEKYTVNNTIQTDDKDYSNVYKVGGFINARYAKPLNLYWQTGAGVNASYGIELKGDPRDRDGEAGNYTTNIFRTSINGLIQYLPNSRTSIGLDITGSYQHSQGDRTILILIPTDYQMTSRQFSVVSSFNMYYYISPRFRVQFLASINGNNSLIKNIYGVPPLPEEEDMTKSYHHNLSLTLTYSFF